VDPYRPQLQGPPPTDYIGGELPYPSSRVSQAYELQDDPFETGPGQLTHDIPLLQREDSAGGASLRSRVPGAYEPSIREDPEESTNIRYGRIPQRVPRRYKTMKKVE
jgi:chitin synthase